MDRSVGGALITYLRNVIGTYTPTGDGFGGADWEYIFSAILLIVVLYSVLRMIGSLFK